ncbi:MAG TPA: hypothetical protein PLK04_11855, partial [Bacillota bacterium]|nr:hypothetical protein [Bacillota bacterium]
GPVRPAGEDFYLLAYLTILRQTTRCQTTTKNPQIMPICGLYMMLAKYAINNEIEVKVTILPPIENEI